MKIRTQYFVSVVVFGLLLAGVTASVLVTNRTVERLNAQAAIAAEIERGASDLSYMANDYLLGQQPQQRERWEARWTSIDEDLSRLQPDDGSQARLVRRLRDAHARLRNTFEDVATVVDSRQPGLDDADFIRVSWSRLAVQSQSIVFDSLNLSRSFFQDVEDARRTNRVLVFTLLTVLAVFFAVTFFVILRRALVALAELTEGAHVIGSGNLDHTIPIRQKDEIGQLSRAFNQMTADLKTVIISKTELEREVKERQRAEQVARQELETSEILLEAAESLARWTDLPAVLGSILHSVQRITGHSRASVALLDEAEETLQFVASRGSDAAEEGTRFPVARLSVVGQEAVRRRIPLVVDYDALEEAEKGEVPEKHARLGFIVPIVHKDHVVGVIRLDEPGERLAFGERDQRVMSALASQAATAIVNARLYESDHRIAETLQAALLAMPNHIVGMEFACFYHSATQAARVGGDFYDIFDLEPPLLSFVVGDISGKGLDAAVVTSLMKSTIRAKALESDLSPADVMSTANSVLYRGSPSEGFATAFFGIYDRDRARLRYCNAGHTSGALLHHGGRVTELSANSPLVGALDGIAFLDDEVIFEASDLLFLYTDGLTEARCGDEFYGEQRLFDLLSSLAGRSPDDIVESVFEAVVAFTRGNLNDDVAILALQPKG